MASTRDRIITATNELFRRQGYHATSLKEISVASGATIGSIYHFFPGGKEALGVAVVETTGAIYRELFETLVAEFDDPATSYRQFCLGAAAVLVESEWLDPCPIGGVARETANTSEPLRAASAAAFDSWVEAANAHLQGVGVAPDRARSLATMFVATIEGTFVLSRTRRSTEPLEAAGEHLAALVTAALDEPAPVDR
ncbi:MAG: TetR/AcrR family transcriptional regulator [Actinomycetota bacterium]